MAISPSFPPNFFTSLSLSSSSSSSPSLPFLTLQNKTHSSHRNLKHESFCANQTIDFETEVVAQKIQVKKKRKLRPSFHEQVRDRWSLKNHSQRDKFPWQKQEKEEAETAEEEEVVSQSLNSVEEEEEEKEVTFDLRNKISAPWVYKTKPKAAHFNSIVEKGLADSAKVSEFKKKSETHSKVSEFKEKLETPKRVVVNNDSNYVDSGYQFGLVEEKLKDDVERVSFDYGENENVGNSVVVNDDSDSEDYVSRFGSVEETLEEDFERVSFDSGKNENAGNSVVVNNDSDSEDYVSRIGLVEEKLEDGFERVSFDSGENENVGTSVGVDSRGGLGAVLPWEMSSKREAVNGRKWKRNKTEVAEKSIPEIELKRLRNVGLRMQMRIKVGAAGITQALVEYIHEKWKVDEVVKLKFEGPPVLNMQRTHDVLESRTGGLVIWRSGSSIVLFRGMSYKFSCVQLYTEQSLNRVWFV